MPRSKVNRRDFLKTTAAGAAAASALSLTATTYSRAKGANERIGVAFVGTGGRCQEHIGVVNKFKKENKGAEPVAVCDVWDGHYEKRQTKRSDGKVVETEYIQGLYPSAKRCGLDPDD